MTGNDLQPMLDNDHDSELLSQATSMGTTIPGGVGRDEIGFLESIRVYCRSPNAAIAAFNFSVSGGHLLWLV